MIGLVAGRAGLEVNVELFSALTEILGGEPTELEPVVIVAAYVHSLAKGYGLSESQDLTESQLERADPPAQVVPLLDHCLGEGAASGAEGDLRDRLYAVFVDLSRDGRAREALNRNEPLSEVGLLTVAQIFWNIERTATRSLLPITSAQGIVTPGHRGRRVADIRVPNANLDFATMKWTERAKVGATGLGAGQAYTSRGQGFRTKGARLAVLAAQRLVAADSQHLPSVGRGVLDITRPDRGSPRARISWPYGDPRETAITAPGAPRTATGDPSRTTAETQRSQTPVLVGSPAAVGETYQRRTIDAEIDRLWAEGDDRRVWLLGGPGLGKSYAARRVIQEALGTDAAQEREDLLIWVDSADAESLTRSLSTAADKMPHLGLGVDNRTPDGEERQARALLQALTTSTWRWLIVLDNADAASLIGARMLPPGGNPNGRVLITTLSHDHRIGANGRPVKAGLFTPEEAEALLRRQVDPRRAGPAPLTRAPTAELAALASAVGHHPLALSIAAATIVANAMDVKDWLEEFNASELMDVAADEPDPGGYHHLIGATWRLALAEASQDLPAGLVERAAAVAAVLDPDGHPTWLWDRDAVAAWVAGGSTLPRHHGRPIAVQRLIDHGIVELVGDTWKNARLAIHQLAARAVRELMPAEELAELGQVLLNEWLMHLAEDEPGARWDLRGNLLTLTSVVALPSPADVAAAALLGFTERHSSDVDHLLSLPRQLEEYRLLAGPLERAGSTGQAHLAGLDAHIGGLQIRRGLINDGHASLTRAATAYQTLIADRDTGDDDRADYLRHLGDIHEDLGHPTEAQNSYATAAEIYRRLTDDQREVEEPKRADLLHKLSEIYDKLGRPEQRDATIARKYEALERAAYFDDISGDDDQAAMLIRAESLEELGKHQRENGQANEARATFTRAAECYRHADLRPPGYLIRGLVSLHIETGDGDEAEKLLTRLVHDETTSNDDELPDDLVRLACVQKHRGRPEDAATTLTAAADLYQARRPKAPPAAEEEAAQMLRRLATAAFNSQRWSDANELHAGLLGIVERQTEARPSDYEHDLAHGYQGRGLSLFHLGQAETAADLLKRAARIRQTMADLDPGNAHAQEELAETLTMTGGTYHSAGRFDEADAHFRRLVEVRQSLAESDPASIEAQAELATALLLLGGTQSELGHTEGAEESLTRSLEISRALADLDPGNLQAKSDLANAFAQLGWLDSRLRRWDEAAAWYTRSLEIRAALAEHDRSDVQAQIAYAHDLDRIGGLLYHQGNLDEAETWFTRSVNYLHDVAKLSPGNHQVEGAIADTHLMLGVLHLQRDRLDDATDHLTLAINILRLLTDIEPPGHGHERQLIRLLKLREELLRQVGRTDEAEADSSDAADLVDKYPELRTDGDWPAL